MLDTANTLSWLGGDSDVAILTPRSSPGVSHDVKVLTSLRAIADSGDGVIELGSAFAGVQDTGLIHLEDSLVSLNGDRDWALSDGSLQLVNGLGSDVVDLGNENLTLGGISLALAILGVVWVVRLSLLLVGLEVGHGVLLPSTIASIGLLVAVNQLLLGEAEELSSLLEMSTLDGNGGREGPA